MGRARNGELTAAEQHELDDKVLLLIATGLTDAEMVVELDVPYHQVQTSGMRLRIHYNAKNRAHMVALAYHAGDLKVPRKHDRTGPECKLLRSYHDTGPACTCREGACALGIS